MLALQPYNSVLNLPLGSPTNIVVEKQEKHNHGFPKVFQRKIWCNLANTRLAGPGRPVDGVNDSRDLSQADHVLQAQVLDVGLPYADELAQQADTGLQQLGVGLHGQSQGHRLKDDGVLSVILVDVLGHLISCMKEVGA